MPLAAGVRLGPYEVLSQLGVGGMGEVWRATDTNLGRQVAIKVLPDAFAQDAERLARFEREAKTLAALNHPNIAAIHGLEKADGARALVMELVEGPTLADRIAKGPIAVDEALPIAKQIAEALEAAHEQGIIHRDLKPANVKVREDGTVKVLDFGLAKAMEPAAASVDTTHSPTITSPAMTEAGVILGTAAYMSPEQARGKPVDKRTDIWAFGCVLYETLTGRRAFHGEDVSETVAAILRGEPEWRALPPDTPESIRRLLRRCLSKDRKTRLPDIAIARIEIDEQDVPRVSDDRRPTNRPARWAAMVAAIAATALLTGGGVWLATRPPPSGPIRPIRLSFGVPDPRLTGASTNNWDVAISPDGQRIVYLAGEGSALQLNVRELERLEATPLPAGKDVVSPFFSPDGRWVAFVDETANPENGVLKRMPLNGEPPTTIARVGAAVRGASWGPDGTIVFGTIDRTSGLMRVNASGGNPEAVTAPPESGTDYFFPEVLPGGRAILFTIVSLEPTGGLAARHRIAVFDLETRQHKVLIEGGSNARYASSGHLVYAVDGTLFALPFDARTLQLRGTPVPVLSGVITRPIGAADFAISSTGTLVYRTGLGFSTASRTVIWVDRRGVEVSIPVPLHEYTRLSLSPEGSQLALEARNQQGAIYIWNFDRRTLSRLTRDSQLDAGGVWTSDGKRLVFSRSADKGNLFWQPADGSAEAEQLTQRDTRQIPTSLTPDGNRVIFHEAASNLGLRDIGIVSLQGDRKAELLLANPSADEANGDISPDGRWLAYDSTESGQRQIFVRPFPNVVTGRWQVSTTAGSRPKWSRDGRELFYWEPTSEASGHVMAARVEPGSTFRSETPQEVVKGSYPSAARARSYDVSRDGQRFVIVKDAPPAASSRPEFVAIVNWLEELKRLVPTN